MGMNFFDFLASPWHALESLGGKVIDAPRALLHEPLSAATSVAGDAANVVNNTVNQAGSTVQGLGGDLKGSITGVSHELHGAADDMTKNLILPLSIGAGVLAVMMFTEK